MFLLNILFASTPEIIVTEPTQSSLSGSDAGGGAVSQVAQSTGQVEFSLDRATALTNALTTALAANHFNTASGAMKDLTTMLQNANDSQKAIFSAIDSVKTLITDLKNLMQATGDPTAQALLLTLSMQAVVTNATQAAGAVAKTAKDVADDLKDAAASIQKVKETCCC